MSEARAWKNNLHLRRGVRRLLRDLRITAPLDISELCERLGERRGQPIKLRPYPLSDSGVSGLWLAGDALDCVLYQAETTPEHQQHIVLHEIGHIISGHGANNDDDDLLDQLFPDLPPDLVRRALRRDAYERPIEIEAELVASVIREWGMLLDHLGLASDRSTESAHRVQGAFDDHQGWL